MKLSMVNPCKRGKNDQVTDKANLQVDFFQAWMLNSVITFVTPHWKGIYCI